ncbi:MAG: hemerythrin domain-containing protein [Archangium sp.]|nr:hemerythrin domain-containing protein [Archangium sp.]
MKTPDLYDAQAEGLTQVHRMITAALDEVAAQSRLAAAVTQATGAARFVLAHHHVEDTVLFPGLRELGNGATAFLDARDREHRVIHSLAERLLEHAAAPGPRVTELVSLSGELRRSLAAHVAEEEAGLSAENLRQLITVPNFTQLVARLEAARAGAAKIAGR